jgi:hypothetical protein
VLETLKIIIMAEDTETTDKTPGSVSLKTNKSRSLVFKSLFSPLNGEKGTYLTSIMPDGAARKKTYLKLPPYYQQAYFQKKKLLNH